MEFREAKSKFLDAWGDLGNKWGINKTMAQIHALLMISPTSLSMDEIMEELDISRGNTSMNLRALIDWGLIYKEYKAGERREYFAAEQDVDQMARKVAEERSRREIKPTIEVLQSIQQVDNDHSAEARQFTAKTKQLYDFISDADHMLEKLVNQKENWITKTIMKLMR
ncbi:GbsR/MarR family transcriptional regulator [Flavimarina sp. Hel_I_48]|uniref:GbsR/MarR family transcriptional regulator n=1 Tax=Flavimarina sp. Hel_I_48 TaxID=1392488 RepID=UPI0004DEE47F|nr:MarR family transcriptional regulator [Flavimarina sp. Hel_I_48]